MLGDVKFISGAGPAIVHKVDDRTTSSVVTTLQPGEPVKKSTNFAIPVATGDPEVGTDEMLGIVRKESTETSTADGEVEVLSFIPGLSVIRAAATTPANMDTAAELLGIIGDHVAFDVTASSGTNGVFTIDENEGDDPNVHGLKILRGNTVKGTLDCLVHALATMAAPLTGQTMD